MLGLTIPNSTCATFDVPTFRRGAGLDYYPLPSRGQTGVLNHTDWCDWAMGGEKMIPPTETIVSWSVIPQIPRNAMSWYFFHIIYILYIIVYVFKVYMWGVEHFNCLCGWIMVALMGISSRGLPLLQCEMRHLLDPLFLLGTRFVEC